MNVVLYTTQFEPITVIDLPIEVIESVEREGILNLVIRPNPADTLTTQKVVQVLAQKLKWTDGSTKTVLVTEQEELALLLKPEWLAGQQAVVQAYKRTLKLLTDKLQKLK